MEEMERLSDNVIVVSYEVLVQGFPTWGSGLMMADSRSEDRRSADSGVNRN